MGSEMCIRDRADSEEKKDAALGKIEDILNSLGYQISDTVRTSYLFMLQNRKKDRHGTQW